MSCLTFLIPNFLACKNGMMPLTSRSPGASVGVLRENSRHSGSVQGLLGSSELRQDRGVLRLHGAREAVPWATFLQAFLPSWSHMHMYMRTHAHTCTHPITVGGPAIPTTHRHGCPQWETEEREQERVAQSRGGGESERGESGGGRGRGQDTVRKDRSDRASLRNEGAEHDLFERPKQEARSAREP